MGESAFVDQSDLRKVEDDLNGMKTEFKKAYEEVKSTIDVALERSIGGELAEQIKTEFYKHDDEFQGIINSMQTSEDFIGEKGVGLNRLTAKLEDQNMSRM